MLLVEVFVGDLHLGESLGFLLFELFAVIVDLEGLLIVEFLLELLVIFAFLLFFHLLLVPVVSLELLESSSITGSQIFTAEYFESGGAQDLSLLCVIISSGLEGSCVHVM